MNFFFNSVQPVYLYFDYDTTTTTTTTGNVADIQNLFII